MSGNITITDEQILKLAFSMCSACSSGMEHEFAGKNIIKFARAVLEAAPASSAIGIAMDCLNKIIEFCPPDSSVDQLDDTPEMRRRLHDAEIGDTARYAISALQSQLSPVQAIEPSCKHHFVMDSEHPSYSCCQHCGTVMRGGKTPDSAISPAVPDTHLAIGGRS